MIGIFEEIPMKFYVIGLVAGLILIFLELLDFRKRHVKKTSLGARIRRLSSGKMFKYFTYPPGSTEYKKIQSQLMLAGFRNVSVNNYQLFRYIFPLVAFVFMLAIRYTNAVNSFIHSENVQEILDSGNAGLIEFLLEVPVLPIFAIAMLAYFAPDGVLKLFTSYREARGNKETMMLHTYSVMMLKAKRSVKYILHSLKNRSKVFKPELEIAINSFSRDPIAALETLKKSVPNEQFQKVCVGFQQALNNDPDISIKYLQNHRTLSKELAKIYLRQKNAKKNIAGLLMLILPLVVMGLVVGYPWFVYALGQLSEVPM